MKPETDLDVHVTLRHPMRVKLQGVSTPIDAFDASILEVSVEVFGATTSCIRFQVDRLYLGTRNVRISLVLLVPITSIVGMALQPFAEKK